MRCTIRQLFWVPVDRARIETDSEQHELYLAHERGRSRSGIPGASGQKKSVSFAWIGLSIGGGPAWGGGGRPPVTGRAPVPHRPPPATSGPLRFRRPPRNVAWSAGFSMYLARLS